jgi:hypothetical protein
MAERLEDQFALTAAGAHPPREGQRVGPEVLDHRRGRPDPAEGFEEQVHTGAHARIRVADDAAHGIMHQAHRERHPELPAAGLVEDAALQPGAKDVEFRFAHRALEPQEQPVVELRRMVHPVLIQDECVGQRTDLEEAVPVGRTAGQPRDLEAEDNARAADPHLRDQPLEARPGPGAGGGLPEVVVDDHDPIQGPAQGDRAVAERILPLRALGVLD